MTDSGRQAASVAPTIANRIGRPRRSAKRSAPITLGHNISVPAQKTDIQKQIRLIGLAMKLP
jgi:hypothetical protein